jgi:hypothetical protein
MARGRFSPSTSVSPANLHSTNCSTITLIYHLGLYNRPEVAIVPGDVSPTPPKKTKNKWSKRKPGTKNIGTNKEQDAGSEIVTAVTMKSMGCNGKFFGRKLPTFRRTRNIHLQCWRECQQETVIKQAASRAMSQDRTFQLLVKFSQIGFKRNLSNGLGSDTRLQTDG